MTTIREEIKEILDHSWDDEHDETADEIIEVFEKRIDSISKQYMKYYAVPDLINEIKEMLNH